ncbi:MULTISPECIES: type I DNA topoisomerase [unclassified Coleofasciculus]|uniref:type I DNA topoisomerase n=1 Tax=unclassified Coleofasciculus TaxID=2692782 RepID=UPI0018822C16|nr:MULTISPECIES: type I DNA topoisomerase [unclassified Coleofasciculus]MBE9124770.1 type I DNA topoisomerase [Coleofasciculus sp. LEGE 07081]MBE9148222.1 type I DNA topoisomerase [Coleofasciculus sp. LEGE 07092]
MQPLLVILESPGKRGKVGKILGDPYKVVASVGHVRELAEKGADSLGFKLKRNPIRVECDYVNRPGAAKILKSLQAEIDQAQAVYIATDPDREGECIAWHLIDSLEWKSPPIRVSFSEITDKAVKEAIANPRPLDESLVAAARARDCLDKLVGYKLSPLLWEMNNGAKSAGRCQSAALRLLCRKEAQIERFVPKPFWKILVRYPPGLTATYIDDNGNSRMESQQRASSLAQKAKNTTHRIEHRSKRQVDSSPPPAFKTSTLQQEAGKRLGLSSSKVMRLAQTLYEEGYITYHRSDSVVVSPEFAQAARNWLIANDPDNLPETATQHRDQAGVQAGHEAIRPTDISVREIQEGNELNALYQLIWKRAIASQCARSIIEQTELVTVAKDLRFEATGKRILFPGYGKYWDNLGTDKLLPDLEEGQTLTPSLLSTPKGKTRPPNRFSEPQLVQVLEKEGVGRPSTFANIISTLLDRGYVRKSRGTLIPTRLGKEVDRFLQRVVPKLIEPGFTKQMEDSLDAIAHGTLSWQEYLVSWHDNEFLPTLKKGEKIIEQEYALPEDEETELKCHYCGQSGLIKRYSNSLKLEADHYLVCNECDSPHFWNSEIDDYQLPYKLRRSLQVSEENLTDYQCPVCNASLERHHYTKQGQQKTMLRCSQLTKSKCRDVAYFKTKDEDWWSPKFGVLASEGEPDFSNLL